MIHRKGDIRSLTLDLVGGRPSTAVGSDRLDRPPAKGGNRMAASQSPVPKSAAAGSPQVPDASVGEQSTVAVKATLDSRRSRQFQEVLLVDEVDVFFGQNFYGRTHNQVAVLEAQEVVQLFLEIWGLRDQRDQVGRVLQHVKANPAFKAVLDLLPTFQDLVEAEVVQMCCDLAQFHSNSSNGAEYIFEGNAVGYKILDGIAFDVVQGYQTAFAYLQENARGNLKDSSRTLRENLTLRIPCGRFSYANLSCPKILGVSGTIHELGRYETEIMQKYGISNYTIMPSVYGKKKIKFLGEPDHKPIMITEDGQHFFTIADQADQAQ